MSAAYDVQILVRLSGELATKARGTRNRFQRRVVTNLKDALESSGIPFRLNHEWGRVYIEAGDRAALDIVPRLFGVKSISEIELQVPPRLETIVAEGARVFGDRVRGRTFAVRARRAGRHPFNSADIHNQLGAALNTHATVNLSQPDVTVFVEVRSDAAYLFSGQIAGPGGLPLGVGGRALALLSGGFDSAVAAWMLLKRGVTLDYVFCNLAGAAYERSVLSVAKYLADCWSYGSHPRIHIIEFEDLIGELRRSVRESFWQVVLKRLMYRSAEAVARFRRAEAIVTGEAIGQVSSQTLTNLRAIEACVSCPIIRPLVGFDKEEIIARSRAIGTYELSEKVQEYCALTINRPVTGASAAEVDREEAKFDLSLVDEAVAAVRTVDLRRLDEVDVILPYLYTTAIADDSVVIDTRSAGEYAEWHYPGAVHREYWEVMRDFGELDKKQVYILYCDVGIKTAQLAERMQRAGFEAYSFRGGVTALMPLAPAKRP